MARMSKRADTRRRWERIVGAFERAGVSQAAFAADQRVGEPALRYWIYKLRAERRGAAQRRSPTEVRLLPVNVAPTTVAGEWIEVRAGDVAIAVPAGTAPEYLAQVVAALRANRC